MAKKCCCHECKYADWDADGCTCMIDGRLVYNASDYTCDQYRPAKPLTNGDRIRQMTDEEFVMALDTDCNRCAKSENCKLCGNPVSYGICVEGNIEWLKQEVEKDDER